MESDIVETGQNILELDTKRLPVDLDELEGLRNIMIVVYNYLFDNKWVSMI